jgi:hypothetical protein
LSRSHAPFSASATAEHKFAGLFTGRSEVVIDSLAGLLSQFKPDRLPGLLLADGCPIGCIAVWGNVLDLQRDHITSAKFAIDGQIEHRKIARSSLCLKLAPNRPDMLWPQWRFGSRKLSFVPRLVFLP